MLDLNPNHAGSKAVIATNETVAYSELNSFTQIKNASRHGHPKVTQPLPALPAFNVAAEIFAFVDLKDKLTVKLRMISKRTTLYSERHLPILAGFLVSHDQTYTMQNSIKM